MTDSRSSAAARTWVLAATILGSSLAFIDGTVVNVALPALQHAFDAKLSDLQWVVEAYALTLSALLLTGGSLDDLYGRRKIFAAGVVLFAAASFACGMARTMGELVAARAIQGCGAALLVPGSLALITSSFPPADRGRAIGTWSGFTAITTAAGPVLGGWLVEHVSWRWVFFINVPIAIAVVAITLLRVPEYYVAKTVRRIDWAGVLLTTAGLGAVVFGFIESKPLIGIGGAAVLALFVVVEARSAAPMLPLSLFRSRTFAAANLLTLLLYAALGGLLFFFPLNLIQVQGYSATEAGAAFLPFIALMSTLSRWSGGLIQRYGSRLPLIVGPAIAAGGFALFARPGVGGTYWTTFLPAVVVLGLGMAVTVAPLTTTVMGSVPEDRAGIASGVNNAVSRVAGLLAVAVFGVVLSTVYARSAGAALPAGGPPASPESFVGGFRAVVWVAAALALASAATGAAIDDVKRGRGGRRRRRTTGSGDRISGRRIPARCAPARS